MKKDNQSVNSNHPLTYLIKIIVAIAGLVFILSSAWAEAYINPNEVWINVSGKIKICGSDFDKDGDMDLFSDYGKVVTLHENVGIATHPKFLPEKVFISRSNLYNVKKLGLNIGLCSDRTRTFVDIDNDGDLDLFKEKFGTRPLFDTYPLEFHENTGTNDAPSFNPQGSAFSSFPSGSVIPSLPFSLGVPSNNAWGTPLSPSAFTFVDIDNDGDADFFQLGGTSPKEVFKFYENIGTPEVPQFSEQSVNPVEGLLCSDRSMGFFVDINNDGRADVICTDGTVIMADKTVIKDLLAPPVEYYRERTWGNDVIQTNDIDQDGDMDFVGMYGGFNDNFLANALKSTFPIYNNSLDLVPQFKFESISLNHGSSYQNTSQLAVTHADLNADHAIDLIYWKENKFHYIFNRGTTAEPVYNVHLENKTDIFGQCQLINEKYPNGRFRLSFVDIDADNDLDLFMVAKNGSDTNGGIFYCENTGDVESPFFSASIISPFGINVAYISSNKLIFGDVDGDGDQDLMINGEQLYDNTGTAQTPFFQRLSYIVFPRSQSSNREYSLWVDMDNDGRVESILNNSRGDIRLIYKGLEPVTDIVAVKSRGYSDMIVAVHRPSQIQLYNCSYKSGCGAPTILPMQAKEISLSTGVFTNTEYSRYAYGEVALAMIDNNGRVTVNIYDSGFNLISHGKGGVGHSISISAGQLNSDSNDEIVVSFVQENGKVLTAAIDIVNITDMSIMGLVQLGKGKQPSVAVGNFSEQGGYALSYITSDNQLKTATIQGDGTIVSQGNGGSASYAKVSKATFLPEKLDGEYVVSTLQENGVAGLVGFSSNGSVLGKLTGVVADQPTVVSKHFSTKDSHGLAVSLIQADKKPAVIFLDNQGKYLATGVGSKTAQVATVILDNVDINGDAGILVYVDEAGIPRWEIFNSDGSKVNH